MPGLDPLAKLKALAKSETGADPFTHEGEDAILRQLLSVFIQTPTGKELVDKSKLHQTGIKLLKGRNDFSYSPESNTVYLGIPPIQSGAKARMLLFLAMGLEEARQEFEGMPNPRLPINTEGVFQIHTQKQEDILFVMCHFAYECINSLGLREILDEVEKIGHIGVYKAFEQDVREGHTKV